MTFLDRNGQVIATRGAKYGQAVALASLPAYAPKAFLAAEDRRFYQHGPVDLRAIGRAIVADLRARRSAEGASTLTQQLARGLFLKRDQSLKRKVQEAYLAWRLEQSLSKDQILELYLNRTYFGAGAYGLDAAAETYFGKPASRLTLMEAATLAGLPNAPSRLALTTNLPAAVARGGRILRTMLSEGWVSASAYQAALANPPVLAPPSRGQNEGDMGYVIDQAAEQAVQLTDGQTPDLVVATTIDPGLQSAGSDILRRVVEKQGAPRHASQGALVALAPDGAIVAMVGGLDHDKSSFNRVVQARRQPGSAFKAFVYGAAMEHGLTPADVREDAPIALGAWRPENYGHAYAGSVTLRQALARSLNTVSVRLTEELGPDTIAAFARRLGLDDAPAHPGPSIALGAYEVTPLELAGGYQVFQDGGGRTSPYLIREIRSTRGQMLYAHPPSAPAPVLDPLYATRMVDMLKAVITSGTGTGADIGRPAAGKTGTSQNWRDAWFVGFTPDLLAAVWVGNDDGRPMAHVAGGDLPAQIWRQFMTLAEKGLPPRDFPWLVPEPNAVPDTVADSGLFEDEPPVFDGPDQSGGGAFAQADPDWSDRPAADDRRGPDSPETGEASPADRWGRRAERGDYPPDDRWTDDPAPYSGRHRRDPAYHEDQTVDDREQRPPVDDDNPADSADESRRYRY